MITRPGENNEITLALQRLQKLTDENTTLFHAVSGLPRTEKIAIIGAGPAGLSAAYCLSRMGYSVALLEALPVAGGMMVAGIPAARLPGKQLSARIKALLNHPSIELHLNIEIGKTITLEQLHHIFDAVILATGCQYSRQGHISGEQLYGVIPALEFLKRYNLHPFTTKIHGDVAIIGSGYTAFDSARVALNAGATQVHIIMPGVFKVPGDWRTEEQRARQDGVLIHKQTMLVGIVGTEDMNVQGVHCQSIECWDINRAGEMKPRRLPGSNFCLKVQTVLIALGEDIDPSILQGYQQFTHVPNRELTQAQIITALQASPDVFLAGDINGGPRTLLHAIEDGCRSATNAHKYLRENASHAHLLM